MNSPTPSAVKTSSGKFNVGVWLGWTLVLLSVAYFLFRITPRFFVFSPESYGGYYWAKASWLFPHVVCGILAAVIGPLQFWPRLRRDYLPFHRIAGRVYVVVVLVGSIASLGMSLQLDPKQGAYAMGLAALAVAWLTTTGLAFVAIRRKNLVQHKQWMVRSYVITFAFVAFRLGLDVMKANDLMQSHERLAVLAWGSWAVPLLFTEVALQAGAIFKSRA